MQRGLAQGLAKGLAEGLAAGEPPPPFSYALDFGTS